MDNYFSGLDTVVIDGLVFSVCDIGERRYLLVKEGDIELVFGANLECTVEKKDKVLNLAN